jgi:hypothetical protein
MSGVVAATGCVSAATIFSFAESDPVLTGAFKSVRVGASAGAT